MSPLVSICIPTYNGARYLLETLQSADAQTYGNIEIVISDDQSSDSTVEIARRFADTSRFPVRIIAHTPSGMGNNWNDGIRAARGAFVKMLFQDDLIKPTCVQRLMEVALEDERIGLVFCARDLIVEEDVRGTDLTRITLDRFSSPHRSWTRLQRIQEGGALLADPRLLDEPHNKVGEPPVVLLRKSLFERVGGFDSSMPHYIDVEMWLRLMSAGHVGFVDEELASFRLHRTQKTRENMDAGEFDADLIRFHRRILMGPAFGALAAEVRHRLLVQCSRHPVQSPDAAASQEAVATHRVDECPLCGSRGKPLHVQLRDRALGTPGDWNLVICEQPKCQMVWMNPMPDEREIARLHSQGHPPRFNTSHERGDRWSRMKQAFEHGVLGGYGYVFPTGGKLERLGSALGRLASFVPNVKDAYGPMVHWLPKHDGGRLLVMGCGSGQGLARLRDHGWIVAGVESDAVDAQVAREHLKLDVHHGTIESAAFATESFDAVVMNHMLERVANISRAIQEAVRVLKPGGRLVVVTPNMQSRAARRDKDQWVGLDPPRHLFLFSPINLPVLLERNGLRLLRQWTSVFDASRPLSPKPGVRRWVDFVLCPWSNAGQHLVAVAQKP